MYFFNKGQIIVINDKSYSSREYGHCSDDDDDEA